MNNSIISAIYLRKSRADDPHESITETLQKHESLLQAVCKKGNYLVPSDCIYREVVSGENIFSRPQMIRLLDDVTNGKYHAVICIDIDRLGRGDMRDQGIILDTFKNSSTLIVTPDKVYDLNNEMDEELTEFKGFMARREYKMITKRLRRGREETVKAGGFVADPPYGWRRAIINDLPSLEPDETEGPIMQMIVKMYSSEEPIQAILNRLDLMGIKNRKGQPFCRSSIRHIACNPVNAGYISWNKKKNIRKGQNGSPTAYTVDNRPEDILFIKGVHEPQVPVEMYEQAIRVCKSRSSPSRVKGQHGIISNPTKGIVLCGKCGKRMQLQKNYNANTQTLLCLHCKSDIVSSPIFKVEMALIKILEATLQQIRAGEGKKQDDQRIAALSKDLIAVNKKIEKLKKQQNKLYNLLEQEVYTIEIFQERNSALKVQISDSTAQTVELQKEINQLNGHSRELLAERIEHILANYWQASPKEKNHLLKSAVENAIYYRPDRSVPCSLDVTFLNL